MASSFTTRWTEARERKGVWGLKQRARTRERSPQDDMYAVIKTGGKQQKVQVGDVIEVEKLVAEGDSVEFHPLLVVDDDGTTHVGAEAAKAVVVAKPLGDKKGDKVKVFKYRPKSGYARKSGHRQLLTVLEVTEVKLGSRRTASKKQRDADADASEAAE